MTNSGNANLTLGTIESTGDFSFDSSCGGVIAPGGSCGITVRLYASMSGSLQGQLRIPSNAEGSPHIVTLSGTGCRFAFVARSFTPDCGR